jgi:hypothetical protein
VTPRTNLDIMARVLAKHAGVSLDDVERLVHARGVRTRDGAYMLALFGNPVQGLVVKHRQIRITKRVSRCSQRAARELLVEADERLREYNRSVRISCEQGLEIAALGENEIVLADGGVYRYDETWRAFLPASPGGEEEERNNDGG